MNNNFNFNLNNNNDDDFDKFEEEEIPAQTVNKIRRLFFILLSVGLVLGAITAFGVIKVLNHFGLTDKTPQLEIPVEKQ